MNLNNHLLAVVVAFFPGLSAPSFAQSAAAKAPVPVRASVGDVTDNRSTGTFFSECKVELKFTGDAAADAGKVRQVRVLEAVDETGRDLKPEKSDDMSSSSSFNSRHSSETLTAEVKLRNPSRNAATIKNLKGEVELFSPTEQNGAILHIKDVLKHPAEPIQNATLAQYGVQLMYLTKQAYDAKKKELDAQQKAAAGDALGAAFGDLFKGMFGGMMSDSKNSITIFTKDPDKRIVSLEFQDAQGHRLKSGSSWNSKDFQQTQFDAPAPEDTQLVVQLAVPEALRTFSFEVHDIPLP